MIYVKKSCPKCGATIQNWKSDAESTMLNIGVPFEQCQNCKEFLIKPNTKEVNMLTFSDYIIMFIRDSFLTLLFCLFISSVISLFFSNLLELTDEQSASLLGVVTIICVIIYLFSYIKQFKKEINSSKERLKNKEYAKIIDKIINNNLN